MRNSHKPQVVLLLVFVFLIFNFLIDLRQVRFFRSILNFLWTILNLRLKIDVIRLPLIFYKMLPCVLPQHSCLLCEKVKGSLSKTKEKHKKHW